VSIDKPKEFVANPSLKVDRVSLKVSNLQDSINFYKSILGFGVLEGKSNVNTACMGPSESKDGTTPSLLVLSQIENGGNESGHGRVRMREAGLYHFAILLPERGYLGSFLNHIQSNLDTQFHEGMADHAVSESIYLHDPDHNGIEVYRDRKPSEWKWVGENKVYMATEPLDVNSLLKEAGDAEWSGLPAQTSIGHVHLHVSNLAKAKEFYHQSLGLYHTATYPGAYFFAADGYHHHVATNTWIGTNILRSSANDLAKPGLEHFAIRVAGDKEEIYKLKSHLIIKGITIDEHIEDSDEHNDSSFYVYDSDGIKIQVLVRNSAA
jgi:catechol 2,3-dioxygenase